MCSTTTVPCSIDSPRPSTIRPKHLPAAFGLPVGCFGAGRRRAAILLVNGLSLMGSDRGLGPRALRDITAAVAAGRFTVDDPTLALAVAAGALLGLGKLLQQEPERDDAAAADRVTEDVLRLFGLPAEEARQICQRPLPGLDGVAPVA
ncbi:TetR/AcrR family transcriptional regulator [Mycolicibacterium aubagnense]